MSSFPLSDEPFPEPPFSELDGSFTAPEEAKSGPHEDNSMIVISSKAIDFICFIIFPGIETPLKNKN